MLTKKNYNIIGKILVLLLFINCNFLIENKPIQNPGLGIKKNNNIYDIYFDVGIFTFENYTIGRSEIEKVFEIVIPELQEEWGNIKLNPVIDQPQDAPYLMETVVSRKLNPEIETFRLKTKFLYHNNFIVEEVLEENSEKKPNKFFLSSQLHHYLYSQVRYDLLIIPLAIISDFDYENKRREIEIHHHEIGIAKGRTALDKIGVMIHLDYNNLNSLENKNLIKAGLISLILNVSHDVSREFFNKNCSKCKEYIEKRKQIFELFYNFNSGNIQKGCGKLAKSWIDWSTHEYIESYNKIIKKQIQENFENFKKKCKEL